MDNALIVHGGAPTAVMNASLYGAVTEAAMHASIGRFYAALGGVGGIPAQDFLDMKTVPDAQLERLPHTPASAIGTSRQPLAPQAYGQMAQVLRQNNIRHVFFNGGNGTMDTCGKLYLACRQAGVAVQVVGIPKTIDNDIAVTDHAPGFGSAARYMAGTVAEVAQDVRALPIHVCVLEAMGRNAGWLTAASALARDSGFGPDLIYLPEHPFEEDAFLAAVQAQWAKRPGVLVVASEGLQDKEGKPIVPPVFETGRSVYYGDVGAHLAALVTQKLGLKARSEKPGLCARASITLQSGVDRDEAVLAGKAAVQAALAGQTGVMVGFERLPGPDYAVKTVLIPLERVMLEERVLPAPYMAPAGQGPTEEYLAWCRPLLGGPLGPYTVLDRFS